MIDIFISYTSKDHRRVWPLAEALKEYGWRVWWDEDMRTGAKIDKAVKENLKNARAVVGVCSRYSHESDWVFAEMDEARKRNILFPVLIDDIEPPFWLGRIYTTRLAGWSESSSSPLFQKLKNALEAVLGFPEKSAEKAQGFESPWGDIRFKTNEAGTPDSSSPARVEKPDSGSAKSNAGDTFKDPTVEFPRTAASKLYRFPSDSLQDWSKRLQSERLIGVRSPNDEITSAAVDSLLELDDWKDYDVRLLAFDAKNQERTDLFFENLLQHGAGKPNRATIVVVDSYGALPFIESILCGPHKAKAISTELKWRDLLFMVQIGSRYQRELAPRFETFRFGCWDVDWLEPMLTRLFPNEAQSLLKRLLDQRAKEFWGDPHDDLEFHEILQATLATGKDNFKQALARNESTNSADLRQQPALDAFRSGAPYCRGILLCAAFFPGLDITEFKRLCLAVVGDAKVFVPDSIRDTDGRVRANPRESTLKDEWAYVGDGVFEECGLTVGKSQSKRSVTFTHPEERASLTTFINSQAFFFADTARKLWAAGFFFGPDSSTELVDGMITLFVEAIDHDSSQKQPQWLANLLVRQLGDEPPESLSDLLEKAILSAFVLSRVSRLLRALLGLPERASLVKLWFSDLLARRGHLQALRLATHLRYADGFDYLYWLKRLCDEAPDSVRRESYLALLQHARQSSAQIWDFLSELESWLPGRNRMSAQGLSNSNEDALRLIIEYSFDAGNELKPQDAGKWPSRYPLFRDLALDRDSATKRVDSLVSWLFHPALTALFDDDSTTAVWHARGQLVLLWSSVLLGLGVDNDLIHAEARETYDRILTLCWQNTDQDQAGRGQLCEVWRTQKELFRAKREKLDREGFAHFTKWIRLLETLENDFRAVAASQHESSNASSAAWSTAQM
ncbi:MAG TPA: toll/interleukin-1 receptor domain-containing protein [Candidatus Angelobacter sp.]|jgi:hypothetical protein|nr:toll/interleukin-1 receptor domain-containing protein [Candidatus Angelobacter sp.]